jgi:hypothetical protein
MNTGWEIRPLGWVLLVLLVGVVLYYAVIRLTLPPKTIRRHARSCFSS